MNIVKRYKLPCFVTHRHGLQEAPDGYIVNAADYDALAAEVKKINNENESLKSQLKEAIAAAAAAELSGGKKKKTNGKWAIKVPIDEDEWVFVKDLTNGSMETYSTRAEAEKAGAVHGMFRVEKVG